MTILEYLCVPLRCDQLIEAQSCVIYIYAMIYKKPTKLESGSCIFDGYWHKQAKKNRLQQFV